MDGQSCAGRGQLWGILQQSVETYPDWWYACQGLGPPEPELRQGRSQVSPSRPGPYQWRPSQRSQHVKAQPWPAPDERCQQGYHNQGWQECANRNLFLDLWCPNSAWTPLSWLWEIWCRTIHSPSQTLLQVSAIWPWSPHLPSYWRCLPFCVQAPTNRMIVRTKNLPNAQTATVHILPPAGNAKHSSLRKELSRSKWRVAAYSLQRESKQGRPPQLKWQ